MKNIKEEAKMKKGIPLTSKALGIIACTKNSNWNEEEYLEGVIKPYRIMEEINGRLESEGRYPNEEEAVEIVNLIKLIFKTKKLPIEDQKERFQELINESEINNELKNILISNF